MAGTGILTQDQMASEANSIETSIESLAQLSPLPMMAQARGIRSRIDRLASQTNPSYAGWVSLQNQFTRVIDGLARDHSRRVMQDLQVVDPPLKANHRQLEANFRLTEELASAKSTIENQRIQKDKKIDELTVDMRSLEAANGILHLQIEQVRKAHAADMAKYAAKARGPIEESHHTARKSLHDVQELLADLSEVRQEVADLKRDNLTLRAKANVAHRLRFPLTGANCAQIPESPILIRTDSKLAPIGSERK